MVVSFSVLVSLLFTAAIAAQPVSVKGLSSIPVDKPMPVRGYLISIASCPPCPPTADCERCEDPNVRLADQPGTAPDKAVWIQLSGFLSGFSPGHLVEALVTRSKSPPFPRGYIGAAPGNWYSASSVQDVVTPLADALKIPVGGSTTVEGIVDSVSGCAPCPENATCEKCVDPHVLLSPRKGAKPEERVFVWLRHHPTKLKPGQTLKLSVTVENRGAGERSRLRSDWED